MIRSTKLLWYPPTSQPEPNEALMLAIPIQEPELAILGTYSETEGYLLSCGTPVSHPVVAWCYAPTIPDLLPAISAHIPSKTAA